MLLLVLSLASMTFFDFVKGEGALKVVAGGIFLHDVLGYGGVLQSLYHGLHYHLVRVGGLAHW